MNFAMIMFNQNMVKTQNFVTWIQTASLSMYKQMILAKILQRMLKIDLILPIVN